MRLLNIPTFPLQPYQLLYALCSTPVRITSNDDRVESSCGEARKHLWTNGCRVNHVKPNCRNHRKKAALASELSKLRSAHPERDADYAGYLGPTSAVSISLLIRKRGLATPPLGSDACNWRGKNPPSRNFPSARESEPGFHEKPQTVARGLNWSEPLHFDVRASVAGTRISRGAEDLIARVP